LTSNEIKTLIFFSKNSFLAIEIATQSIEAFAKHEANYETQSALGALEIQKLKDAALVEKEKQNLSSIAAKNAAIESCGSAIAESKVNYFDFFSFLFLFFSFFF